jgi:hypothetical protein
MCFKVMNFVKSLKIQFGRIVENFKLNASNFKKKIWFQMEISTIKN